MESIVYKQVFKIEYFAVYTYEVSHNLLKKIPYHTKIQLNYFEYFAANPPKIRDKVM